jgi:predicted  nucleic acid-binding Zn-ribbon protein
MDYQTAVQQIQQIQQQAQDTVGKIQALAQKLAANVADKTAARDLVTDLREVALGVQQEQQQAMAVLQQLGQYIQTLEGELNTHPTTQVQPRGWSGGGGFLSSLTSGLAMGAGFGLADDLLGGLF